MEGREEAAGGVGPGLRCGSEWSCWKAALRFSSTRSSGEGSAKLKRETPPACHALHENDESTALGTASRGSSVHRRRPKREGNEELAKSGGSTEGGGEASEGGATDTDTDVDAAQD